MTTTKSRRAAEPTKPANNAEAAPVAAPLMTNGNGSGTELVATPEPKTPTIFKIGAQGAEITNSKELWAFANYYFHSNLVPKGIDNVEAVFVAVQFGLEIGLRPSQAVQSIAVVNNRPSIWGDAMLGLCRQSGLFDEETFDEGWDGDGPKFHAYVIVRRLPSGKIVRREFSMEDANRAQLLGKDTYKGYPKRMLQMRARAWALRDAFADILKGMLATEELINADGIPVVFGEAPATATVAPGETKLKALSRALDNVQPRAAKPARKVAPAAEPEASEVVIPAESTDVADDPSELEPDDATDSEPAQDEPAAESAIEILERLNAKIDSATSLDDFDVIVADLYHLDIPRGKRTATIERMNRKANELRGGR